MDIPISEEFKKTINYYIELSETKRVDHIVNSLIEGGVVDREYGHLIFSEGEGESNEYNIDADLLVLDAIEDEIKRQLLKKFDE